MRGVATPSHRIFLSRRCSCHASCPVALCLRSLSPSTASASRLLRRLCPLDSRRLDPVGDATPPSLVVSSFHASSFFLLLTPVPPSTRGDFAPSLDVFRSSSQLLCVLFCRIGYTRFFHHNRVWRWFWPVRGLNWDASIGLPKWAQDSTRK